MPSSPTSPYWSPAFASPSLRLLLRLLDRRLGVQSLTVTAVSRSSLLIGLVSLGLVACAAPGRTPNGVEALTVEVVVERSHDPGAYTEGLELDGDRLYESTGLPNQSSLREVDPVTGDVKRAVELEESQFGEGITVVDDRIIQLTWKNGVALVYQLPDLTQVDTFTYQGEGWGLCDDGSRLVMSDGTDRLYFRDRATFEVLGSVAVRGPDGPMTALNELECVDRHVYANVYQTDNIVRIDPVSGEVTAVVSAVSIHPSGDDVGVMNGIAHNADTGTFLLTGKNWPSLFEVRFVQTESDG